MPEKRSEGFVAKQRFAFVLRLWLETEVSHATTGMVLRGSLELVEPKEVYYFSSFNQIPTLLQTITGWSNQSGPGPAGEEGKMET
ncbi:MAG: hypothetical protein HC875_36555 [Anaerolineales bacterium]|nr:hypothetical protein [Anaerolineales bacterium]